MWDLSVPQSKGGKQMKHRIHNSVPASNSRLGSQLRGIVLVGVAVYALASISRADTTIVLRLDASEFTAAGDIATWPDTSGNGHHAAAASDPAVVMNVQNGLPVVRFDADDYTTVAHTYTCGTAFAVAEYDHATFNGYDGLYGDATASGAGGLYWGGTSGSAEWGNEVGSPFYGTKYLNGTLDNTALTAPGTFNLYSAVDATPNSSTSWRVGGDRVWGGTRSWEGDIAELIVYEEALSDFDRKGVEVYLDEKWGLGPKLRKTYGSGNFNVDTVALGLSTDEITLVLRLDASEFTSAGAISTWSDSSGNGYDATATGDPTVVLAEQNGLAVVRQDGNDLFIVSQEYTTGSAFIVAKYGATIFPSGGSTEGLYGANTGYGSTEMYFTGGGGGVNWANEDGSQFENAKWFNGVSGHTGISDPAAFNLSTGVDVSPRSFTSWAVGADRGFGAGRAWTGDIAEVVVYEEALSAYNRKGVEVYLDEKWNLGIGLRATYGAGNFNDNAYALHLGPPQGTMITIQ